MQISLRPIIIALSAALLLASCTHSPIPEGYKGPLARIVDTIEPHDQSSADFYYVAEVNGQSIENALSRAQAANYGNGFQLRLYSVEYGRNVPAAPATFTVVGRTHHAAPILSLFNTVYEVRGKVTFTPAPGEDYVVTGVLAENSSAVWIEEKRTHKLIGEKVEIKGSAKLGILEK